MRNVALENWNKEFQQAVGLLNENVEIVLEHQSAHNYAHVRVAIEECRRMLQEMWNSTLEI